MMTIARNTYYAHHLFPVTKETFEDIKRRLEEQDLFWKHKLMREGKEVIVFGSTGLISEEDYNAISSL